jgi:aminobenzoyl-glutamate transport protein
MSQARPPKAGGILDWIEWIGNKLPDPALLFVIGAVIVMVASHAAVVGQWNVQPRVYRQAFAPVTGPDGQPLTHEGQPRVRPVLDPDGKPQLELVSDARRILPVHEPPPADAPAPASGHGPPLLDDEGEAIFVLSGDAGDIPPIAPRSLLSSDGLFWCLSTMVRNFLDFPPLGVVLVAMLGIGVAEKSGMLAAALKAIVLVVPRFLLTPTIIFVGINSSLATDAGYVVLPPLAAALYASLGRSPLAGIAAAFAGIAAGFNANLLITSLDPLLANLTSAGAQVIDPDYVVAPTCNWWFMIASVFVITLAGWAASSWLVEPRFRRKTPDQGGPPAVAESTGELGRPHTLLSGAAAALLFVLFGVAAVGPLATPACPLFALGPAYQWLSELLSGAAGMTGPAEWLAQLAQHGADAAASRAASAPDSLWLNPPLWLKLCAPAAAACTLLPLFIYVLCRGGMPEREARGLAWAAVANAVVVGGIVILAVLPGSPLFGKDPNPPGFDRWVAVIVPLILLAFVLPGVAYGVTTGSVRRGADVAKLMTETMGTMAPIIILAFFAGQFIAYFRYSNLDRMLAMTGGQALAAAELPSSVLIVVFILVCMFFNLLIASMSAKYSIFAPVFVPMLMMVGISPELTQVAYRIGDSVTNVLTPLNAYMVILLVFAQKYVPKAGIGTLISMMLPYSVVFGLVWIAMLVAWMTAGWDLGLGGPLQYTPAAH